MQVLSHQLLAPLHASFAMRALGPRPLRYPVLAAMQVRFPPSPDKHQLGHASRATLGLGLPRYLVGVRVVMLERIRPQLDKPRLLRACRVQRELGRRVEPDPALLVLRALIRLLSVQLRWLRV